MSIQTTPSFFYSGNIQNIYPKMACSLKTMAFFLRDADLLSMSKEVANEIDPIEFWKAIPLWIQPKETWTHFNIPGEGSIKRQQLEWCLQHEVQMNPLRLVKWNESMEREHFWEVSEWSDHHLCVITGRLDTLDLNLPNIQYLLPASEHNFGKTLLQMATLLGHYEIVEALLDAGADVNGVGTLCKIPPLKFALMNCDLKLISLLINSGSHVNGEQPNQWFPLTEAAMRKNLESVKMLLPKIWNINQRDLQGNTPLIFASGNGDVKMVNLLLEKGMDVNEVNNDHMTPLSVAAFTGQVEIVKTLLNKGADANMTDINKTPPLFIAIQKQHREVFDLLIERVKDLNHRDEFGNTALVYACSESYDIEMIKKLLKNGADISVVTENKLEPGLNKPELPVLHSALLWGRIPLVDFLLKNGAKKISRTDESINLLRGLLTSQPKISKKYYSMLSKIPLEKVMMPARQELQTQSVGHLFKIDKTFEFIPISKKKRANRIEILGDNVDSPYWLGKILKANELIRKKYPEMNFHSDLLRETFSHTLDHLYGKNELILERIKEGKPTLLLTGSNDHGVSILILEKIFALSETSGMTKKPFQFFSYNPKKLTLDLLNLILEYKFRDIEGYKDLFWTKLPNLLDLAGHKPNSLLYYVEKNSPIQYQTSGNCTYACVEGAVWGLFILDALINTFTLDVDNEHWKNIMQIEIKNFAFWQNFHEAYHLERYLGTYILRQSKENSMKRVYKLDSNLLDTTFQKSQPMDPRLIQIFQQLETEYKNKSTSSPQFFF